MLRRLRLVLGLALLVVAWVPARAVTYTLNTTTLNSYSGVHPRLFLDASTVTTLRTSLATTNSPYATVWANIKSNADSIAATAPWTANPGAPDDQNLWQRTVGNNMATLAMAYLVTKPSAVADDTYWIEAEDTVPVSPMALHTGDATASGQGYIATPSGSVNTGNTLPPSAVYSFVAAATRTYYVWARVYASNNGNDSMWANLDGATNGAVYIPAADYGAWSWVYVASATLSIGNHQLQVTYREPGLKIDKFLVTSDANFNNVGGHVPSGIEPEEHWLESENFTLNPAGSGGQLTVAAFNDPLASNGTYLISSGIVPRTVVPATGSTPDAQQTFSISGGNYDVWIRAESFNNGSDSIYYALDGGAYTYGTISSPYFAWGWNKLASNIALAAGSHTVALDNREINCRMDRIVVVPTGTTMPDSPNPYLVSALGWARAASAYGTWGSATVQDLPVGHLLLGLAILYDWAYGDLADADKQLLLTTLSNRGTTLYNGALSAYWTTEWLQNHLWVCTTGLAAAAAATYGDTGALSNATLQTWINLTLTKFSNTMTDLGPDGASQEGVGYWEYGVEWMLKYMDLSQKLFGADMFSTGWFQKTAYYRLYFSLPQNSLTTAAQAASPAMGSHIDVADDPRIEWYGPSYILRGLAKHGTDATANGLAQWLATRMDANGLIFNAAPWLNLLWYNTGISELAPTAQPTFYHFDDMDFTVSRSAWDGNESVVTYQCGPFMGRNVQAINTNLPYVDWGGAHTHPAANNFSIFGSGDWQIRNSGYYRKFTDYENSLLVSNPNDAASGQLGEGGDWLVSSAAKSELPAINTTNSFSTPALDYLVGDAASAYDSATGLTKYRRHLLFLKPSVLVAVDDVTLTTARNLEMRFFPEQQTVVSNSPSVYTAAGTNSFFRFEQLTPTAAPLSVKTVPMVATGGLSTNNFTAFSVAPTGTSTNWSNAVAMTWSAKTGSPSTVAFLQDGTTNSWKFKVAAQNQTIVLDRDAAEKARAVISIEAESATALSSMAVYTNVADASGGQYLSTAVGTPLNNPDTLSTPSASYPLNIPAAGTYAIWARAQALNNGSDSFWWAVNPAPAAIFTNACYLSATYGVWGWIKMGSVSLAAGTNSLSIKYREPNCKFDQFIVTDDASYTPTGKY